MKNRKVFILNPSQSRRLIAKAVVNLPQIQNAFENGKIYVSRGSTNAYILDEIYKILNLDEDFNFGDFVAGQIVPGKKFMKWWINKGNRSPEIIIEKRKKIIVENREKELNKFKQGDIFIKGANAIDINGIPAVLAGGDGGGTIGSLQGILQAKGIEVICPIGLEKLIFTDVISIQQLMGTNNMDVPSEGIPCGLIPMPYSTPITEVEAFEILFDCEVYHVASGGVGGAEGSVSILVDSYNGEEMEKINGLLSKIADEPIYQPNL